MRRRPAYFARLDAVEARRAGHPDALSRAHVQGVGSGKSRGALMLTDQQLHLLLFMMRRTNQSQVHDAEPRNSTAKDILC